MKTLFKNILMLFLIFSLFLNVKIVKAVPFYDLNPSELVIRGEFYTTYSNSTEERKHNISLCVKSLDKTLIPPGEEFSFNNVVGERTAKRGYKESKIIFNGEFSDGIGGGVCQVSSTLYNALLLSDVNITECHPHSLQVSYVAPSFDAMVNYHYADLRFVNNTDNPIYILANADGNKIKISVYGEKNNKKIIRKSIILEEFPIEEEIKIDELGEYPELNNNEKMIISYGRAGIKSQGYLYVYDLKNNLIGVKKIRENKYAGIKTKIIQGKEE